MAENDLKILDEKDRAYGGSWKRRGGVNAFCMLARKWDRIETGIIQGYGEDGDPIYKSIFREAVRTASEEEGLLAQIGDLRRYLMLVEAEVLVRLNR